MAVGTKGLYFQVEDFIGHDIAKTKLVILTFLCYEEFVKTSIRHILVSLK